MSYFLSRDVFAQNQISRTFGAGQTSLQKFTWDRMSCKGQTDLENVNGLIWTEYLCLPSPFICWILNHQHVLFGVGWGVWEVVRLR